MVRFVRLMVALSLAALLGACASSSTRMARADVSASQPVVVQNKAKSVSIWLNDDAKKLLADNMKFNADALKSTVERSLTAQSLLDPASEQTMDIEVTSFRVRSAFSAIMFGFMAGNDNVEGIVTIKGANGSILQQSKVKASYALGGIGGGQDEARMSWLYEEFAKHAVAELSGTKVN
ncbi:MAG: DUF4410 domain-containing protein [Burkholderiales bacterium]|jgi:hypothetical protein|nr:MAG: DUF4410 domain-containing protein [Burkholderiales bacterium]